MGTLQRIHAGVITGAAVVRALGKIAFSLLLTAGGIWAIHWGFTGRSATLLTICVSIWAFSSVVRTVGTVLGPPEPTPRTGTQAETRRALRRARMLGGR